MSILLTLALASFGNSEADPAPKLVYIKAGQLFDGAGDSTLPDRVIVVEGDRIKAVGSILEIPIPSGAEVIDLSKATVLPGLIDAHTHLGSRADRYDEINKFKDTPNQSAFAAVLNAKKTLEAGFTTVRDVGSRPFLAVDLRESIDEGFVVGPRIVASGPGISITGGHGDLNRYAPQVRVTQFPEEHDFKIADGVDQVRHVVRAQIKYGVDVIKVNASGGVLSRGDSPGAPQDSRRGSSRGESQGGGSCSRSPRNQERGHRGRGFDRTWLVDRRRRDPADGLERNLARRRHL